MSNYSSANYYQKQTNKQTNKQKQSKIAKKGT